MPKYSNAGLAAGGAGLIGGLADSISAYNQAKADNQLKRNLMEANNQKTIVELTSNIRATEAAADDAQAAYKSQLVDQQIAANQARGAVLADAGASGTGGSAIDMQLEDVTQQTARNLSRLTLNKDNQIEAIQMQQRNAIAGAESSMQLMPTQTPSKLAYSLSGLAGGLSQGYSYMSDVEWMKKNYTLKEDKKDKKKD